MAANMVEPPAGAPPLRHAFSLTRYSSVSLTSPCLMALKTSSAVISFIMLDGALNSPAFFSNNTLPLEASIRIAVGASPSNPPSSFLAPCTLLLAANTTPPHPTAMTTTAGIRPRHERPIAGLDLRDGGISTAIGDALSPGVLTVGSTANNTGFTDRREADPIAAAVNDPTGDQQKWNPFCVRSRSNLLKQRMIFAPSR